MAKYEERIVVIIIDHNYVFPSLVFVSKIQRDDKVMREFEENKICAQEFALED